MCYVLLCVSIYISTIFLWLKVRYPRKDLWQHQCICLFFQQIISASSSFLYFTYLFINVGTVGLNFWSLKMFVFFVFQNYYQVFDKHGRVEEDIKFANIIQYL